MSNEIKPAEAGQNNDQAFQLRYVLGSSAHMKPSYSTGQLPRNGLGGSIGIELATRLLDEKLSLSAGAGVGLLARSDGIKLEENLPGYEGSLPVGSLSMTTSFTLNALWKIRDEFSAGLMTEISYNKPNPLEPALMFVGVGFETNGDDLGFRAAIGSTQMRSLYEQNLDLLGLYDVHPAEPWPHYWSVIGLRLAFFGNLVSF